MPKRFTDSNKWQDSWFGDLPTKYKLFWLYLLDNVNHAGIWKINFKLANFLIGEEIELTKIDDFFKNRIVKVNKKYWFVPKFIKFQYPNGLKSSVKAQNSVIKELIKYNIDVENLTVSKQLGNTYVSVQDKDKDIDIYNNSIIYDIFDIFVKELKNGKHSQAIEQIYMRLKIKQGSLTPLLLQFKSQLIIDNVKHKDTLEMRKHFNNWLNVQNNKGLLDKYKK